MPETHGGRRAALNHELADEVVVPHPAGAERRWVEPRPAAGCRRRRTAPGSLPQAASRSSRQRQICVPEAARTPENCLVAAHPHGLIPSGRSSGGALRDPQETEPPSTESDQRRRCPPARGKNLLRVLTGKKPTGKASLTRIGLRDEFVGIHQDRALSPVPLTRSGRRAQAWSGLVGRAVDQLFAARAVRDVAHGHADERFDALDVGAGRGG